MAHGGIALPSYLRKCADHAPIITSAIPRTKSLDTSPERRPTSGTADGREGSPRMASGRRGRPETAAPTCITSIGATPVDRQSTHLVPAVNTTPVTSGARLPVDRCSHPRMPQGVMPTVVAGRAAVARRVAVRARGRSHRPSPHRSSVSDVPIDSGAHSCSQSPFGGGPRSGQSKAPAAFLLAGARPPVSTQCAPEGIRTPNLLIRRPNPAPKRPARRRRGTTLLQSFPQVRAPETPPDGPGRIVTETRLRRTFGAHSGAQILRSHSAQRAVRSD